MSTLTLIPVPGGRVRNGKAVLSVVITPRLTQALATAGMGDWPSVINAAANGFAVHTRATGSTTADASSPTATLLSVARTDVWEAFFGTIGVTPATASPRGYHPPAVLETTKDAAAVRQTYLNTAMAIGSPQAVERELDKWHGEVARPTQPERDTPVGRVGAPDFHRAVAMLREHPQMLRLLGLIVDLELEGLPQAAAREVSVTWDGSPVNVVPRWTRYEFDGNLFLPTASGDVGRGVVDLRDEERWRIVGFDVDGAVGKLRGAARMLATDRSRRAEGAPADGGRPSLPPLRSAGLMLTRVGRKEQLAQRSAQSLAASADELADKVLTAEDLVLGYRIDVRVEDTDTWFSLHRRNATYRIGDLPEIKVIDEEGHVKAHAAVIDEKGLRTDEVVARWDGWSLSVPRQRLDGAPSPNRRSTLEMPYDFEVQYRVVDTSLVELEFGRSYQLRARVADIAGGGLALTDPAVGDAAGTTAYVRYEPVPPPQVVVPPGLMVADAFQPGNFRIDAAVLGPGGSLERLVIRSEPDGDAFTTVPFADDPAYPVNDHRTVVAPVTTFSLAEQHGVLRLTDEQGLSLASLAFANGQGGEVSLNGQPVTQLPDPAALGVAVAILAQPGLLAKDVHDERPWEGAWPARASKIVEVTAGPAQSMPRVRWVTQDDPGSPNGSSSPRVQIELPPGCQVEVEVTSTVLTGWIDNFALNRFLSEGLASNADGNAAQTAMSTGRHPLLSPPRRLLASHAVRLPLRAAHGTAQVDRARDETVARLLPTDDPVWGIHVPSTGSVRVGATWREWGDSAEPTTASASVTQLNLPRGSTALPPVSHDFGDTKHRTVAFGLTSISRFRDCFADTRDDLFELPGTLEDVSVPSTARPRALVPLSVVPAFRWEEDRAAGTVTRRRRGGRLRVELARPWFTTGEGEAVAVILWPREETALPAELRDQVTWCNRDPIHATSTLPALAAEAQFTGAQQAVDVPIAPGGPVVRALVYPVFFHNDHWYADIELPGVASASYAPFVRLALARFQDQSLVGPDLDLRMSSVVATDLAPALPDRTLTVARESAGFKVTLAGLARAFTGQPNRVFASLERLTGPAGVTAGDLTSLTAGDLSFSSWNRVSGSTATGVVGDALAVVVPSGVAGDLRLVVREVEEMTENVTALGIDAPDELADRTVFVDVVDLSTL